MKVTMWENANTNLSFLLCEHSIKMSHLIRINSKHFIFIMVISLRQFRASWTEIKIVPEPANSPRTHAQTKVTEHIKISLRTVSIKFLTVITTLYKTKMGDSSYRPQSSRLRRLRFTVSTRTIEHGTSFQSSPKINRILITRLVCIQ